MTSEKLRTILGLCKDLDVLASKLYTKIAHKQTRTDIRMFWETMAKEERGHAVFWKKALAFSDESTIPDIFYDMDEVIVELNSSLAKANGLLITIDQEQLPSNYFLTAYWMEFYLLYPSFITLFHYMSIFSLDDNPEKEYERHLLEFVDGFNKYGKSNPEMELLGSLLHNLWKRNQELIGTSMYDGMTQLLNRKGLFDTMVSFASLAQRNGYKVGVLMIDIDDFKRTNDTYGHQVGDSVIKGVAESIRKNTRKSDLVGRFGGEEFVVFLVNIEVGALEVLAEKIRKAVEEITLAAPRVTVSIGCFLQDLGDGDISQYLDDAVRAADDKLYFAKRNGKNRVSI